MKLAIDKMMVILPFEKEYYKKRWHWDVEYVGHPLVRVIDEEKQKPQTQPIADKEIIALLPGSRKQEKPHTESHDVLHGDGKPKLMRNCVEESQQHRISRRHPKVAEHRHRIDARVPGGVR